MFEPEGPGAEATEEERAAERRAWSVLYEAVRRAVEEGVVAGDPTTQTQVFWASIHGLASLHLSGRLNLGRTTDSLVQSLMDGWLAPSRGGDKAARRPSRRAARAQVKDGKPAAGWRVW